MWGLHRRRRDRLRRAARDRERILALASGKSDDEIASNFGVSPITVYQWRNEALKKVLTMTQDDNLYNWRKPSPSRKDETAAQVLQLRTEGRSYRDIAKALDISQSAVEKALVEELSRIDTAELRDANKARTLELARLDALLEKLWPAATTQGSLDAVDRILKIMDRRSKLLGLDAPTRINIERRLQKVAEENGLDATEVLAEARSILAEMA